MITLVLFGCSEFHYSSGTISICVITLYSNSCEYFNGDSIHTAGALAHMHTKTQLLVVLT